MYTFSVYKVIKTMKFPYPKKKKLIIIIIKIIIMILFFCCRAKTIGSLILASKR